MSTETLAGQRPGLFARVRDILIRPQSEWQRIADEEPSPLISSYVAPLAVLGAVAHFTAGALYHGYALNADLAWRGVEAAIYVLFAVACVSVASTVIGFLIRRFGGEVRFGRADQLAAYSATPMLVAALGAFAGPGAVVVTLIGAIYAFVLLSLGVSRLAPLPNPQDNTPRFTLGVLAVVALVGALAAVLLGPIINSGREALTGAIQSAAPAPVHEAIARRPAAETAIERLAQNYGARVLVDPARLEEQFPETLPSGFARQSSATAQGGGVSRADATYARDAASLRLAIVQLSYGVDPSGAAAMFAIKPDGVSADGYLRSQTIDGRFYAEEVSGQTARYVVIGRGVAMIAEGHITVDQARAAIETIDLPRLEAAFGR